MGVEWLDCFGRTVTVSALRLIDPLVAALMPNFAPASNHRQPGRYVAM
jgi:hypothetical protein